MIRTAIFLLYTVFVALMVLPYGIYWSFKEKHDPKIICPGAQRIVDFWAKSLVKLAGARVTRCGEENIITDRPALWVGNHQGDMDIGLILTELGPLKSIVAKKEAAKVPVANLWMKNFDCVFMDRNNPRHTLQSMKKVQALLEGGRSVIIFPEGTRSKGPEMNEFKAGALRCAVKAGVPIVPFAIDGTYKVFEAQRKLKAADVVISVLPAVETAGMDGKSTAELSAHVQQLIQDELYRIRGEVPKTGRKIWTAGTDS